MNFSIITTGVVRPAVKRCSIEVWPEEASGVLIRSEVVGVAKWRIIRTIW